MPRSKYRVCTAIKVCIAAPAGAVRVRSYDCCTAMYRDLPQATRACGRTHACGRESKKDRLCRGTSRYTRYKTIESSRMKMPAVRRKGGVLREGPPARQSYTFYFA